MCRIYTIRFVEIDNLRPRAGGCHLVARRRHRLAEGSHASRILQDIVPLLSQSSRCPDNIFQAAHSSGIIEPSVSRVPRIPLILILDDNIQVK